MNHLPHVLLVAAGLAPATVAAGYLFALTALGWRAPRKVRCEVHTRFGILIPAHDEQTHLGAALESVRASDYPAGLARAFVVADNCGDATAAVARSAGAWCGERRDATRIGKGHALGWGLAQMPPRELDAVLILDADCRLDPEALTHLAEAFQSGALAAQTAVLADPGTTPAGVVAAVGSEVESAIQAGYTRLGLGVWPRGTGMAFRADLLGRIPWAETGLAEDAQYGARLAAAGVTVTGVPRAIVLTGSPHGVSQLVRQRTRWRAALFRGGTRPIDRLMQSKPLILGHLTLTLLATPPALVTSGCPTWFIGLTGAWATGICAATAMVYLRALARRGGIWLALRHLTRLPGVVARLAAVALGWHATPRAWERAARATP